MMSTFPECLVIYSAFHEYFSCLVPDLTLREYMTGDTCGAGGAHSSGTPGLTLDNSRVHVFPYFLCVCVCRSTLSMSPVCPFWLLHWYLFLNILEPFAIVGHTPWLNQDMNCICYAIITLFTEGCAKRKVVRGMKI